MRVESKVCNVAPAGAAVHGKHTYYQQQRQRLRTDQRQRLPTLLAPEAAAQITSGLSAQAAAIFVSSLIILIIIII